MKGKRRRAQGFRHKVKDRRISRYLKHIKFIHEFELVDNRRIRRVVLPLFRDGELAGRHIIIYDITNENKGAGHRA